MPPKNYFLSNTHVAKQWHEYPTLRIEAAISFAEQLDQRGIEHFLSWFDNSMLIVNYYC